MQFLQELEQPLLCQLRQSKEVKDPADADAFIMNAPCRLAYAVELRQPRGFAEYRREKRFAGRR